MHRSVWITALLLNGCFFGYRHDGAFLARPPGAQQHHDTQRPENGEKNREKLEAFGDLPEQYVELRHGRFLPGDFVKSFAIAI